MRSRQILARLDRLNLPVETETYPDLSLLRAEDYDRLVEATKNPQSFTKEEIAILMALVAELPELGPGDSPKGPKIQVSRTLEYYWKWHFGIPGWRHYSFRENLGKVETSRFLELCESYGWDENCGPLSDRMMEWSPDDEAELIALLDKAAVERGENV
jgi:hypothetical protein